MNERQYKKIDDFILVICFDLYYILSCIKENVEPDLNGFEISKEGKTWIKLLTIRDWMERFNYKYKGNYWERKNRKINNNFNEEDEKIWNKKIFPSNKKEMIYNN